MGQLYTYRQVITAAEAPCVSVYQHFTQFGHPCNRIIDHHQLVGIAPAIRAYGYGFSSPYQLCATEPEALPAPFGRFRGAPVGCTVKTLHR